MKKLHMLVILDGWGISRKTIGNAIKAAKTPTFDYLIKQYPNSKLIASGLEVGVPKGQMGNSEVGHMNIGAGRIIYQPLPIISNSISDKTFFKNKNLLKTIEYAKKNDSKLHIIALISNGGVHSHIDHVKALIKLCKINQQKKVYIHAITDGRDTNQQSCLIYINELKKEIKKLNTGQIASISGRFYAMDRDQRWERIEKAYQNLTTTINFTDLKIEQYVEEQYQKKVYDEFIIPALFEKEAIINNNDAIIFANFRSDRAIQLLYALSNDQFSFFKTGKLKIKTTTLMPTNQNVIADYAFKMDYIKYPLGAYLASLNKKQLRIAETEKYAHVTYYFDGGEYLKLENCTQIMISSSKVKTYDLQPEMSAVKLTEKVISEIKKEKYDFILLNFANPDMVGHTGNFKAAVKAIETVDSCLDKIYQQIKDEGYLYITADHGNAEEMIDQKGALITAHSTNKVPFIFCQKGVLLLDGKLADIAPTILDMMNVPKPKEMTGISLIDKKNKQC